MFGLVADQPALFTLVMLVFLTLALARILLPSFVARDGQPVATR